jgi:hypothetical protein
MVAAAAAVGLLLTSGGQASATPSGGLVINEVYGGGGNSGATLTNDFVAANQTISKLTDAIVAAGGPHYDSREIDPVNDQDGGQPGGNIRVVFLYNPARVTFVDHGPASTNRSSTGTQVIKTHGKPHLT